MKGMLINMERHNIIGSESYGKMRGVMSEVQKAILGKNEIIIKVLLAILSRGHILIEDIPGVGKTTLALAFSKAMSLDHRRLQFTPDVLPTDVTGFSVYDKDAKAFAYKEGAAICNLFLADEINRTSSKTQSALLEVMEEGHVTVDGITREMPKPYIVIATQNPIGSVGTQLLPESQLDRFMVRLTMGYPDIESEIAMLKGKQTIDPLSLVKKVVDAADIITLQNFVDSVYVDDRIYDYIARLVTATRSHSFIRLGLSPRGTIALTKMSKATAFLSGRDYVLPEDVLFIFSDVCAHRVILSSKARMGDVTAFQLLTDLAQSIPAPQIGK